MTANYSNLLQPNPKAVMPVNSSVPNLLSSFKTAPNPVQSALTNKISPAPISKPPVQSWQTTLANVQSALPKSTAPSPISNGGQSLLPSIKPAPQNTQNAISSFPVNSVANPYNPNAGTQGIATGPTPTPAPISSQSEPISSQNTQNNATDAYGNPVQIGDPSLNPNFNYGGLVKSLANQANTPANQSAMSAANAAGTLANNNPGTSGPAFDAYTKAVQAQQDLKSGIAQQYTNVEKQGIPLEFVQGQEGMLNRQYASQLDAAQQAVNEQQAALGYQISGQQTQNTGYQTAGNIANTVQGQGQAALGTAAGLTPELLRYGGTGTDSAMKAAQLQGNFNTATQFTQDYNQGKAKLTAAQGIESQIVNTLNANPTLNNTPLSSFTNLKEIFSGQASIPGQQLLSQQIANYVQTLGLDPASVASIASQQKGTLAQLLKSLYDTSQAQNEAKNPANLGTGNSSSNDPAGIR